MKIRNCIINTVACLLVVMMGAVMFYAGLSISRAEAVAHTAILEREKRAYMNALRYEVHKNGVLISRMRQLRKQVFVGLKCRKI